MQVIDFRSLRLNARLQASWREGELPHFSGVAVGDGRIVVMNETILFEDGRAHNYVGPLCESTIESFDGFDGENVAVSPLVSPLDLGDGMHAVCGEGAMGNEGFVAVLSGEVLLWSAFFVTSNPLYALGVGGGGTLIATSTHDVEWQFPLDAPWRVSTRSAVEEV